MNIGNIILEKQIKSKTSGNIYSVFVYENAIACTCPAGGKKQICKHMINVVYDNLDYIKDKSPEFFSKLMQAIEVKNNKNISYEDKLKEYAKIVYLNKNIVDESIKNIQGLAKSDIDELKIFLPIIKDYQIRDIYHFFSSARKSLYNVYYAKKENVFLELKKAGFLEVKPIEDKDYIENTAIYYTKEELTQIIKQNKIKIPYKSSKAKLFEIACNNNLFKNDMKNYCLVSVTELFATSKDIISYLHKNRGAHELNKKPFYLKFLREEIKD